MRRLAIEPLEDRRLLSLSTTPTATLAGLESPYALAFDSTGKLYVANYTTAHRERFTPGAPRPAPP